MDKLIITVAPTGNVPTRQKTPHVPLTPEEIVQDVYACYNSGAAVAHFHARDEEGKPTLRKDVFERILDLLEVRNCPVVRQFSTGGRAAQTDEERLAPLALRPEMASLCTGSTNFPDRAYVNPPAFVELLAKRMRELKIKPELEIFDCAMIANALALRQKGYLEGKLVFNLVLNIRGAMPGTPKNLLFLVESLPAGSLWTVSVIGEPHVALSTMAIAMGGHVRVGIEDNIYYQKGVLATNRMLVERIVRIARAVGREIASPEEAREMLGLVGRAEPPA
jgi:3-keto-5-aminohexanoate cleavage enzyme